MQETLTSGRRLLAGVATLFAAGALAGGAPERNAPPPASAYLASPVESVRGGLVYGISVQPRTCEIYLASETMRGGFFGAAHNPNNGTWRSRDHGRTWERIGPGGNSVKASRTDPRVVYANDRYGLYKTADGGRTWTTLLEPPKQIGYKGLDVFAKDHNIVYAGGPGWLHVTHDGGTTWSDYPLPLQKVRPPPAKPAASGSRPATNAPAARGPEWVDRPARVQVVQIHPTDPDTAFIAFYDGGRGVWKTTDGGRTVQQLCQYEARAMAVAPSNPDYIYCSGAVSRDGGRTWTPVEFGGAWCIVVHPENPGIAYYSRPGAPVWVTTNGGRSFCQIPGVDMNYDGNEVEGLAIDARHDILWAGGDSIWKGAHAASGRIRLERTDTGFHAISFSDIQSTADGVWACSDAQGMHFTRDGHVWTTTAMGMHGTDALHRVAPSPRNPMIVYAGHESRLFKTVDGGKTWFNIFNQRFPYCLIDPQEPDIVYLSSNSGNGTMIRSADGGRTFDELGNGRFLMTHPSRPGTLYAELPDGMYVSHDRGDTFLRLSPETRLGDVFLSRFQPDLMFSARGEAGLFRSRDEGRSWEKLDLAIKGPTRFAESGDGRIWMADPATGLLRSADHGVGWEKVLDAMGAMAADPWDAHSLYMVSKGTILWVHPRDLRRVELSAPRPDDRRPVTLEASEPLYLDRSNVTCLFTRDIELFGINRSLVLMPRGLKNVTLDGQGHTIVASGAAAIFVDDIENLTIRNFTFVSRAGGSPSHGVFYLSNARNVAISNCVIDSAAMQGIVTRGAFTENVTVERCSIVIQSWRDLACIQGNGRHTLRNCSFSTASPKAVDLSMADGSLVVSNTVANGGIAVRFTENARITDNTLGGSNATACLEFRELRDSVVSRNEVDTQVRASGPPDCGLVLSNAARNTISANRIRTAGRTSLACRMVGSDHNRLEGNAFESAGASNIRNAVGISLSACTGNVLSGNTVTVNGGGPGGIVLEGSRGNRCSRTTVRMAGGPPVVLIQSPDNRIAEDNVFDGQVVLK